MDPDHFTRWVEAYRRAWTSSDPDDIAALFTEDAKYFTEPHAEPWEGRDTIVRGWLDRKDEPDDTDFRFDVLGSDGDIGFVQGWTRYFTEPQRGYSNLWVIRLDSDGRAREFTEWWMKHE